LNVIFITHDGKTFNVEPKLPTSLMRAALDMRVPGIVAECGGSCSCATCHVYVRPQWVDKLPARSEQEASMLECVTQTRPNSRLSCQIELGEEISGLTIELPESQY
jgi:ferredoxin, 2Fe-2S